MAEYNKNQSSFYLAFAWFLLAFGVVGFGSKALFNGQDLPPLTGLHHFHAVAMPSWFALFALQPTLIQRKKIALHRLLGGVIRLVVVTFIGLYSAAIVWRGNAEAHKRLMVYATLVSMGPAAGRVFELFDSS